MTSDIVLAGTHLSKSYRQGEREVHVLRDINLEVRKGERVAIVGLSGSGKSTLLHLLAGLDALDTGDVQLLGDDLAQMSEKARSEFRNRHLGFVYQFHHLMAEFSALENTAMPLMIGGASRREATSQAQQMLARVGLSARLEHRPAELSGGERQRVAIARALVTAPACVLADEPTGNLDETTAAEVNQLMVDISAELATAFVVVTHNRNLAEQMDRVLTLHSGMLS